VDGPSLQLLVGLSLFQFFCGVGIHGKLYYVARNSPHQLKIYEVSPAGTEIIGMGISCARAGIAIASHCSRAH
jgi:hypothetical protein